MSSFSFCILSASFRCWWALVLRGLLHLPSHTLVVCIIDHSQSSELGFRLRALVVRALSRVLLGFAS